jgi:hypothetical protein
MMAIGLGKRQGAELIHAHGTRGLREEIPQVAAVHLARSPILLGVAIVEDGAHHISQVQAIPAQDIPREEPKVLDRARALLARLPVDACDLLIVDRMGKDISGAGMDNNVLGRMLIDGEPEPERPRVGQVAVLRLTDSSHGNATGLGFADLTTQQLIDAMDEEITRINLVTSGFMRRAVVPPVFPNDRAAIEHALGALADPTVRRIRDTLSLSTLQASENLLPELLARPGVELLEPPQELRFHPNGALI